MSTVDPGQTLAVQERVFPAAAKDGLSPPDDLPECLRVVCGESGIKPE